MTKQELDRNKENLKEIVESYINNQIKRVDILKKYLIQLEAVNTPTELKELKENIFILLDLNT